MPNPSTTELFLRWSLSRFWFVVATSCPNSAPITPNNTIAVVCLRFSSAALDGFLAMLISETTQTTKNQFKIIVNVTGAQPL